MSAGRRQLLPEVPNECLNLAPDVLDKLRHVRQPCDFLSLAGLEPLEQLGD